MCVSVFVRFTYYIAYVYVNVYMYMYICVCICMYILFNIYIQHQVPDILLTAQ